MSATPATVLFLHPSAELYGADRTLLQLVAGLDPERWRSVVALPRRGVLADELEAAGAIVEIGELGIGARADLAPHKLPGLALRMPRAIAFVRRLARQYQPAVIHTNTMIVMGGALGAWTSGVPHLWHVHEILERPRWLAKAYARLFCWLSDEVVSNSEATRSSFDQHCAELATKHRVILNGVDARRLERTSARPETFRAELGIPADAPLVVLAGRINSWKGQPLLIAAAARLHAEHPDVRFVCVGDAPPGQDHFTAGFDAAVSGAGLEGVVLRAPFRSDVASMYAAADVCVVPSTRPEPFGLVAAEAMALGRAVVAADHGGVAEIVVHGETGLLFEPGDADALAVSLSQLIGDRDQREQFGAAGLARQQREFSVARYVADFAARYAAHDPRPAQPTLPAQTRIVHLIFGKANPDRANGVNRVVHHLAATQVAAGRNVEVWGLTPTPEAPSGERPYPLRLFRRGKLRLRLDAALRRALRELADTTVFHLHGGFLPEWNRTARLLRRSGHPYVFTPHGAYQRTALQKRPWLKRLALALFENELVRGAQRVQAFTRAEALDVASIALPAKTVVIPNGQDLLDETPYAANATPVFGYLGRLLRYTKGLDALLEGFAQYSRQHDGELVLIGDGPDRVELEALAASLGIADRVRFLGQRFGDEKLALLRSCDAFLHTSRHEGLPGAVLEAAALGLPLILTRGTNLAEVAATSGAGIAVGETDAAAIARALTRFCAAQPSQRARWSAGARDLIAQQFSWNAIQDALADELYSLNTNQPIDAEDGSTVPLAPPARIAS